MSDEDKEIAYIASSIMWKVMTAGKKIVYLRAWYPNFKEKLKTQIFPTHFISWE